MHQAQTFSPQPYTKRCGKGSGKDIAEVSMHWIVFDKTWNTTHMILIIHEANVQTKKSNTIQFRCKDAENANQRTEKHSTCGMSRRGAATRCGAKRFVCGEYIKIQVFRNVVGVCLLENGDI